MDPRGQRVTQNAYFSLSTLTKKLLLVTYCRDEEKSVFLKSPDYGLSLVFRTKVRTQNGLIDPVFWPRSSSVPLNKMYVFENYLVDAKESSLFRNHPWPTSSQEVRENGTPKGNGGQRKSLGQLLVYCTRYGLRFLTLGVLSSTFNSTSGQPGHEVKSIIYLIPLISTLHTL